MEELTGYEEHVRDVEGGGDPRRCPRHPGVQTSSEDGLFDGVCSDCEGEMDADFARTSAEGEGIVPASVQLVHVEVVPDEDQISF